MRSIPIALVALALSLLPPPPVEAAPLSSVKNETQQFKDALAALKKDDRVKAYLGFRELWKAAPSFDVAVLLGQTELLIEKYRDAAEHLALAVRDMPATEPQKSQDAIRAALDQAKRRVATLQINVDQPGAEILLDGRTVGKSPLEVDTFVEPGVHTIVVKHPTSGRGEMRVDVRANEERPVTFALLQPTEYPPTVPTKADPANAPPASAITINPPPAIERRDGVEARTIVLIAGGAVTLLAGGTATYFGLKARSAGKDAEDFGLQIDERFGKTGCSSANSAASSLCAKVVDKNDQRFDFARIANISFAVAGVAAVATGLTYLLWPRSRTPTSAFVVVPIVGPHAGVLSLQGDF